VLRVLLAQVPAASAPAGGTLERVFQVLKADPVIGFLALTITALAVVSTVLFTSYRSQLREARLQIASLTGSIGAMDKTHNDQLASEMQKRIDLAMTVVALQTKTDQLVEAVTDALTSVDDVLPAILAQLERLGLRRKPGTTGSHPTVVPEKKSG
jgi:hypothetical protein